LETSITKQNEREHYSKRANSWMDDTVNASATRQDAERLFYEIRPHHSGDRSKALGLTDFFPARYCFLEILISWYFDVAELRLVRLATRG
jgi:hypothetical protein